MVLFISKFIIIAHHSFIIHSFVHSFVRSFIQGHFFQCLDAPGTSTEMRQPHMHIAIDAVTGQNSEGPCGNSPQPGFGVRTG